MVSLGLYFKSNRSLEVSGALTPTCIVPVMNGLFDLWNYTGSPLSLLFNEGVRPSKVIILIVL